MTKHVQGLAGLLAALERDLPGIRDRVVEAATAAAVDTRAVVAENIPRAFGELERSLSVEVDAKGAHLVAKAPHAAAVEVGSRPHVVPLTALLRWVSIKRLAKRPQDERPIALAIQRKIAVSGTRPTWFMRKSLERARLAVAARVPRALKGAL